MCTHWQAMPHCEGMLALGCRWLGVQMDRGPACDSSECIKARMLAMPLCPCTLAYFCMLVSCCLPGACHIGHADKCQHQPHADQLCSEVHA